MTVFDSLRSRLADRSARTAVHATPDDGAPPVRRTDLWDAPAETAAPIAPTTGRRHHRSLALAGVAAIVLAGGAFYALAPLATDRGADTAVLVGEADAMNVRGEADRVNVRGEADSVTVRSDADPAATVLEPSVALAPAPPSLPQLAEGELAEVELDGPQERPRAVIEPATADTGEGGLRASPGASPQALDAAQPGPLPQDDPRWRVARTFQAPADSEAAALSDVLATKFRDGTSVSPGATGSIGGAGAARAIDRVDSGAAGTVREASSEAEILALEAQMSAENPQDFAALTPGGAVSDDGAAAAEAPVEAAALAAEPDDADFGAELSAARTSAYVNLRAAASNDATVLTVVPANAAIRAASACEHFCEVEYNGQRGFIGKSFVSRGAATARPATTQAAAPAASTAAPETAETAETPAATAETAAEPEAPANRPRPLLSRFMQQDETR